MDQGIPSTIVCNFDQSLFLENIDDEQWLDDDDDEHDDAENASCLVTAPSSSESVAARR